MSKKDLKKEDYLLYSINEFSEVSGVRGRKKLMKLMFFLEHLDLDQDELVSESLYGNNDFIIYDYGPFSFDVMDGVKSLKGKGKLREDKESEPYVINLTEGDEEEIERIEKSLDNEDIQRVKKIKDRFGKKYGGKLERLSLDYLDLDGQEKRMKKGIDVKEIISEKNS